MNRSFNGYEILDLLLEDFEAIDGIDYRLSHVGIILKVYFASNHGISLLVHITLLVDVVCTVECFQIYESVRIEDTWFATLDVGVDSLRAHHIILILLSQVLSVALDRNLLCQTVLSRGGRQSFGHLDAKHLEEVVLDDSLILLKTKAMVLTVYLLLKLDESRLSLVVYLVKLGIRRCIDINAVPHDQRSSLGETELESGRSGGLESAERAVDRVKVPLGHSPVVDGLELETLLLHDPAQLLLDVLVVLLVLIRDADELESPHVEASLLQRGLSDDPLHVRVNLLHLRLVSAEIFLVGLLQLAIVKFVLHGDAVEPQFILLPHHPHKGRFDILSLTSLHVNGQVVCNLVLLHLLYGRPRLQVLL